MRTLIRVAALVAGIVATTVGTARAQEPDPAHRADIERLLEVTGAGKLGAQIANMAAGQIIDTLRTAQPRVPQRAADVVKEVLSTEFSAAFDSPGGLHGTIVNMYAKHFTHEEIKGLLAFYATDLGRKAITEMPALAQESAAAGQAWAIANMPRINGVLQSRLRAEGLLP